MHKFPSAIPKPRKAKVNGHFAQNILFKIANKPAKQHKLSEEQKKDIIMKEQNAALVQQMKIIPLAPKGKRRFIDFLLDINN